MNKLDSLIIVYSYLFINCDKCTVFYKMLIMEETGRGYMGTL